MSENVPSNNMRGSRSNAAVWLGLGLLVVGIYMLAADFGLPIPQFLRLNFHWWALFLLIPGGIILRNVYEEYEANGRQLDRHMRSRLLIGAVIVGYAAMFLFNINLALLWPLALIGVGALMLLNVINR